jgi:hypothetical protein
MLLIMQIADFSRTLLVLTISKTTQMFVLHSVTHQFSCTYIILGIISILYFNLQQCLCKYKLYH